MAARFPNKDEPTENRDNPGGNPKTDRDEEYLEENLLDDSALLKDASGLAENESLDSKGRIVQAKNKTRSGAAEATSTPRVPVEDPMILEGLDDFFTPESPQEDSTFDRRHNMLEEDRPVLTQQEKNIFHEQREKMIREKEQKSKWEKLQKDQKREEWEKRQNERQNNRNENAERRSYQREHDLSVARRAQREQEERSERRNRRRAGVHEHELNERRRVEQQAQEERERLNRQADREIPRHTVLWLMIGPSRERKSVLIRGAGCERGFPKQKGNARNKKAMISMKKNVANTIGWNVRMPNG
jgi:hypothetical protein